MGQYLTVYSSVPIFLGNLPEDLTYFKQGKSFDVGSSNNTRLGLHARPKRYWERDVMHAKVKTSAVSGGITYPTRGTILSDDGLSAYQYWCRPDYTVYTYAKVFKQYKVVSRVFGFFKGSLTADERRCTIGYLSFSLDGVNPNGYTTMGGNLPQKAWTEISSWTFNPAHYNDDPLASVFTLTDYQFAYLCELGKVWGVNDSAQSPVMSYNTSNVDPYFTFLLGENEFPCPYGPIGFVMGTYYRNLLMQRAYIDALNSVDSVWANGLQNVQAAFEFINSIRRGKITIPKGWSDAWLKYRYALSTSIMDTEELVDSFVQQQFKDILSTSSRSYHTHGTSHIDVNGVHFKCTVKVRLMNRVTDCLDSFLRALETYGLIPDLYVVWDFVPYSFVVDWFANVGNALDALDTAQKFSVDGVYKVLLCTFSLKYSRLVDGCQVDNYTRWSTPNLDVLAFYMLENLNTSKKTTTKRLIDAGALITGR